MLKQVTAVVVACGAAFFCLNQAVAQQNVCVVDVAKVFENHSGFNAQLEQLKRQAEEYKFSLQQRGNELKARSEELNNYQVDSAEHKQLENQLAESAAKLEVERKNKTREFVEMEARMHFDTYVQVTQLVTEYCDRTGYRAAFRFNSTPIDANDANSIMQGVNEYIVYFKPQIDITNEIIRSVSGGGANPQLGNRPAGSPR